MDESERLTRTRHEDNGAETVENSDVSRAEVSYLRAFRRKVCPCCAACSGKFPEFADR